MSKLKKRIAKLKGLWNYAISYVLLKHTEGNCRRLQKKIHNRNLERFHVGCGDVLLSGWLNIRFEPRELYGRMVHEQNACLLNFNILKPWPAEDNSLTHVAASHFIEHVDLNAGIRFLQLAFKALKSKGVIRLSCPDLELYARKYVEKDAGFYSHPKIKEWCAFSQAKTPGEIFAAKAYDSGNNHQWFYDFDSLKHILELAGFKNIKRCGRLEGQTPDLDQIELADRELETVYIEAEKP